MVVIMSRFLSAKTTTYEAPETTATTIIYPHPIEIEWKPLSVKEIEKVIDQKKKDNKLHIEVRRKDLFR